jgi:hypothetical protein
MAEQGFEIHSTFYRMPEAFRMGDPVLVEDVSGLTWTEFSDRMDDTGGDPAVMLGMLAVAVWQANPKWRRDRVARFVESVDIADVKFIGDEAEEDARPPDVEDSPKAENSTSKSGQPAASPSDTNQSSTTQVGSQPTSPALV